METETALCNLEESVKKTDSHLDKIVWKLDECEREVTDITYDENRATARTFFMYSIILQVLLVIGGIEKNPGPVEESVLHLLETVTQVKEHYEHLRKEISEVQELQKQVQDSLRDSTAKVQDRCKALRMKLIGHQ